MTSSPDQSHYSPRKPKIVITTEQYTGHKQISRSDLKALCESVHFENSNDLYKALIVLTRPRKCLRTEVLEGSLADILHRQGQTIDLTNLLHHAAKADFEWKYMRYCGSNQVRALLIRSFVRTLQGTGILRSRPVVPH